MVTVQPFSSCVVVTVRPLASVAEEVARARPLPLLRELDETRTEESDETDEELEAKEEPDERADRPEDRVPLLLAMLLTSRPSSAIRTTAQSAGMLIRPGGAAPISKPAALHKAKGALGTGPSCRSAKGAAPSGTAPLHSA